MSRWNNPHLSASFPALQARGPDCGEVYQKGEVKPISIYTSFNFSSPKTVNSYVMSPFFVSLQCKPEYKVAGLYVVDSIVRQSRHQFGADKDVFGPRFTKNITGTFENLCLCPVEDRVRTFVQMSSLLRSGSTIWTFLVFCFTLQSKIVRVLNLWQKNGVFKIEVIQPLLDMAAGSSSGAAPFVSTDGPGRFCQVYYLSEICPIWNLYVFLSLAAFGAAAKTLMSASSLSSGSPPPFAKEPVTVVTANSTAPPAAPLQNSDALAAVAQLFQSTQGQQVCACVMACAQSLSLHLCSILT